MGDDFFLDSFYVFLVKAVVLVPNGTFFRLPQRRQPCSKSIKKLQR